MFPVLPFTHKRDGGAGRKLLMFITKIFGAREIVEGSFDRWLNSLRTPGHGVKIVAQVALTSGSISTTVSTWKLQDPNGFPVRTTIDQIPEEPTINYPEGEIEELV